MKVLPINKCNFKGVFVDKTFEHGGISHLDYLPYSWENPKTFGIANCKSFDITDKVLPDNECMPGKWILNRKYTTDILGTDIFYNERLCNNFETAEPVVEIQPAMNLEESLEVQQKKLRAFFKLKENKLNELEKNIKKIGSDLTEISRKDYSIEVQCSALNAIRYFKQYAEISKSQKPVLEKLSWIQTELQRIKDAKAVDRLIDISISGEIDKEFNPLRLALFVPSSAKGKIVALPHRTITVEEIIKSIKGKLEDKKVFEYVKNLIEKRL